MNETTTITPAMVAASASLPLVSQGGVTVSRFHLPAVATTAAEKQIQRAGGNVAAALTQPTPIRTPNAYRETQARLVLTYAEPRTVVWSRAGQ